MKNRQLKIPFDTTRSLIRISSNIFSTPFISFHSNSYSFSSLPSFKKAFFSTVPKVGPSIPWKRKTLSSHESKKSSTDLPNVDNIDRNQDNDAEDLTLESSLQRGLNEKTKNSSEFVLYLTNLIKV